MREVSIEGSARFYPSFQQVKTRWQDSPKSVELKAVSPHGCSEQVCEMRCFHHMGKKRMEGGTMTAGSEDSYGNEAQGPRTLYYLAGREVFILLKS